MTSRITYASVVEQLKEAVPELVDAAGEEEWEDWEWLPYFAIPSFAGWLSSLSDEGVAIEVVERGVTWLERAARDAEYDRHLRNLLELELGAGFPFPESLKERFGPAMSAVHARGE